MIACQVSCMPWCPTTDFLEVSTSQKIQSHMKSIADSSTRNRDSQVSFLRWTCVEYFKIHSIHFDISPSVARICRYSSELDDRICSSRHPTRGIDDMHVYSRSSEFRIELFNEDENPKNGDLYIHTDSYYTRCSFVYLLVAVDTTTRYTYMNFDYRN